MSDSESPHSAEEQPPLNTELPPLDKQSFAHIPEYRTAYEKIVAVERHIVELYNADLSNESLRDRAMCVRVVGLFLIEFYEKSFVLSELPCLGIIRQVSVASQRQDGEDFVVELGEFYRDYLIRYFLIASGKQEETCTESIRGLFYYGHEDPFETVEELDKHWGEAIGNDYETVRRKVLVRDNYRCVFTGVPDVFLPDWCPELSRQPPMVGLPVIGSHIIWDYMVDPLPKKGFSSEKFFEVLEQLQLQDLVTDFKKSKGGIHDPRNMLSMRGELGILFHALLVWFEPTSDPCEYTTHFDNPNKKTLYPFFKDRVHLESKHGIPPPDRKLLTFYGICSRVGFQSRAVYWEYDDRDDDFDEASQEASSESKQLSVERVYAAFELFNREMRSMREAGLNHTASSVAESIE